MKYFKNCASLSDVKAEYRRLVKLHHPDLGGDTATMQAINAEYAEAVKHIAEHGEGYDKEAAAKEVPEEYTAAVAAAIHLPGVVLDLVGSWVWCTGNTRPHAEALKKAGYKWAPKKQAWYWRPFWAACKGSGKSLDQIKAKYGSERITDKDKKEIAA